MFAAPILLSVDVNAQCTFTGLNNYYCNTATGDTLIATGSGGFAGPGISDSVFNPSMANLGENEIWYTEYSLDTTSSNFHPDSTIGTSLSLSDDDVENNLPIGFEFSFFGNTYSNFNVSSNGFIAFEQLNNSGCCSGLLIPNDDNLNNLIAFGWEDFNPSSGGTIDYRTDSSNNQKRLILRFMGVPHFGTNDNITTQVILYEGTNIIEIHTTSLPANGTATMGIENLDGSVAYAVENRNASNWSAMNDFVRFTPCSSSQTVFVGPYIGWNNDTIGACPNTNLDALSYYSTYNWTPAATTQTVPALVGNYMVTATDASGCVITDTITIDNIFPILNVSETVTHQASSGSDDGSISINITGGLSPFTYLWSTGAVTQNISNLTAGSYTVTITDANECMFDFTTDIGVNSIVDFMNNDISLYPNPSTGIFNLELNNINEEIHYLVMDNLGRIISENTVNKSTILNLSNYDKGIYFLNLTSNKESKTIKLVVE